MKIGMQRMLITYLAGLVACLVVPGMLKAASFGINDTTSTIGVSAGQFEGGFSVNGTQIQAPGNTATGSTTISETGGSGSFTFSGSWIDTSAGGDNGTYTVYFTEGNTNQISDILTYTASYDSNTRLTTLSGSFQSSDSSLGTVPTLTAGESVWNENNGTYSFGLTDFGGVVTSAAAPEPGTAALLGVGLLGLLGVSLLPRLRRCPSA